MMHPGRGGTHKKHWPYSDYAQNEHPVLFMGVRPVFFLGVQPVFFLVVRPVFFFWL